MKNTRLTLISYISATFVVLMLTACGSDGGGGGGGGGGVISTGTASLSLTDAPIDEAQEVVVRFEGAEFQPANGDRIMFYLADDGNGSCEVVDALDVTSIPCEVNLLDYTGGDKVTLLNNATLPAGQYSWVRLILNEDPGYIILSQGGSQFNLRIPSGAQTGLKLHGGFIVAAGNHTDYTIDFDLRKSIHDPVGSLDYILRPTLRMVDESKVGTLSGTIDASIYVDNVGCTGAVYVFADGTPGAPDDEDGTDDPVTTVKIPANGPYEYIVGFLTEGKYLAAFTCDASNDDPAADDGVGTFGFLSEAPVTITAGENTVQNFPLAP